MGYSPHDMVLTLTTPWDPTSPSSPPLGPHTPRRQAALLTSHGTPPSPPPSPPMGPHPLALAGKLLFSGSNDRSIKVWNLELVSQTQSLDSHGSWIRSLATEKDVLCSASKDNTVKVLHTHAHTHTHTSSAPPARTTPSRSFTLTRRKASLTRPGLLTNPGPLTSPSPPSSLSPALGPLAWYGRCGI